MSHSNPKNFQLCIIKWAKISLMCLKISSWFGLVEWGIPIFYLHQINQNRVFQFLLSKIYAKGTEKTEILTKLTLKELINLEESFCRKNRTIEISWTDASLWYVCYVSQDVKKLNIAPKIKRMNESSIRQCICSVNTSNEIASKFDSLQLRIVWKPFERHFWQGGEIDSGGQIVPREQQIFCSGAEIDLLKTYLCF